MEMNLAESRWIKMNLGESREMSRSLYLDFADERYYANDGTGGICCNCNRYFKSQFALDAHQAYCRNLLKGKEESGVVYEEPTEDEPWLDGLINEHTALHYARLCIRYLNQKSDGEYKLVKSGNYQAAAIARGSVVHFNFKAKPDNGPVETFFAQLWSPSVLLHQPDYVQFVVSLGHDVQLPNWGSEPVGDCIYCDFPVHHPSPDMEGCEKLIMGDKSSKHAPPFLPPERLERLNKFFADEMAKYASSSHHRFPCV